MYATVHTGTLLMAIPALMPQSPSLRVLLIEDSAFLPPGSSSSLTGCPT